MRDPKHKMFSDAVVERLDSAKILGVRAGMQHRYTGVWPVVVEGRLFVRSWNDKPAGWFRAFRREPDGSVQVEGLELPVRAKLTRSGRIRSAVTMAFARKYTTPGSRKWVEGFAEAARELTTLEFVPR
ncbi:MAG TPA: DUF2255 family protein [Pyrinomonadaceae bacterium]|nr:DUF2255 family protein [Pyrinomonadaceae bacterium]